MGNKPFIPKYMTEEECGYCKYWKVKKNYTGYPQGICKEESNRTGLFRPRTLCFGFCEKFDRADRYKMKGADE